MAANQLIPPGFYLEDQPATSLPPGFVIDEPASSEDQVAPAPLKKKRVKTDRSFGRGFAAAAAEPFVNLAGRTRDALMGVGLDVDSLDRSLGLPTTPQVQNYVRETLDNNDSTSGQILGNVAGLLPTAFVSKNPVVQSVIGAGLLSRADNVGDFAEDLGWGAAGGFIADKGMKLLGGAISPHVSAQVQRLKDLGVKMTPGEILGGRLKVLEDKAMSWPIVGDFISSARTRSQESFNRATVKNVLKEIGVDLPDDVPVGHDAINFAQEAVSNAYTGLMPQLRAKIDTTFGTRMNFIRQRAKLPAEQLQQFDDILQRELRGAFDPQTGIISGRNLKEAEERLRDLSKSYLTSDNPYVRRLGSALGDTREQLISMLARQNPKAAAALRKANAAYAKLSRVEIAARNAIDGIFSPGQFSTAVRQADTSVRKRSTAGGRAYMQQLSNDGRAVLSNRTPNSFTTDRMLLSGTVGTVGAAPSLVFGPAALAPIGIYSSAALPYTRTGQRVVQSLLTGRQNPVLRKVANATRQGGKALSPYLGPLIFKPTE